MAHPTISVPSLAPPETKHTTFLKQYLTKTLRVTVTDKRVFVGQLKCTDNECNLVLAMSHEYRPPPESEIQTTAFQAGGPSGEPLQMQFTSRYVGLVVVPGEHILKIEHEESVLS